MPNPYLQAKTEEYCRLDEDHEAKHNLPKNTVDQSNIRKFRILIGLFIVTGVFLPSHTPDDIFASIDEQGQWKGAYSAGEIRFIEDKWNDFIEDDHNSEQQEEEVVERIPEPVHNVPCEPACELVKHALNLADRLTPWDVHTIFDPLRFFESVNNLETTQRVMPALLLASNLLETLTTYEFVDALLHGRRVQDPPQLITQLITEYDPLTKTHTPKVKAPPTRFFLRYNVRQGNPIPGKEMREIQILYHEMAKKLTYRFGELSQKDRKGASEAIHGNCDAEDDPKTGRATACKISIDQTKLDALNRDVIFMNGCGGMETLRSSLSLATTLIHEFGHALAFLYDDEENVRGEMVFENDQYYKPNQPGEIGWALEKHIFGVTEAEENLSDMEVCWWFNRLLWTHAGR